MRRTRFGAQHGRPVLTAASALSLAVASLWPLPTLGQSYQTALPVNGAERLAIESRLPTILDNAPTDAVTRFNLPSGRSVAVRSYRKIQRRGGEPCRGYRMDLYGAGESVAVDGFRCRRADGRAWLIVEPEIVLSASRPPAQAATTTQTTASAPLAAVRAALRSLPEVPVPSAKPAPPVRVSAAADLATDGSGDEASDDWIREEIRVATDADSGNGGGQVTTQAVRTTPSGITVEVPDAAAAPIAAAEAPREDAQPLRRIVPSSASESTPSLGSGAAEPLIAAKNAPAASRDQLAAAETAERVGSLFLSDSRSSSGPGEAPAPDEAEALEVAAISPDAVPPRRIVGGPRFASETSYADDEAVVTALLVLDYLEAEAEPSAAAVDAAVSDFALDERFALPVSNETLLERLATALKRSEGLAPCGAGAPDTLCFELE